MEFNGILTDLSSTTAVEAIIGAAALIALVGFAKWASPQFALFFDMKRELQSELDRMDEERKGL